MDEDEVIPEEPAEPPQEPSEGEEPPAPPEDPYEPPEEPQGAPEGEMVPDGDPIIVPVTEETVDEDGNTVVTGYPPGSTEGYTGTPGVSPEGPGLGIGIGAPEGDGGA